MNKEKKLYIKEMISPLEMFPYKQVVKNILLIKNNCLKKWTKKIIKLIIKLNYEIRCLDCRLRVQEIDDNILCIVPIKKMRKKSILKIVKNIKSLIKKEKVDRIILSEKLRSINQIKENFSNSLSEEGKYLLKIMIDEVISYISHIKNQRIENQTVSILVNEYSEFNLGLIKLLAHKVKSVNIVTNTLNKFLKFENKLYENEGIMITVSNNKRKSISKANWIINLDFTNDILGQYNINRTAIFINLVEEKFEVSKSFSGVAVNGLKIRSNVIDNVQIINGYKLFNPTILYESSISRNKSFEEIREKIKKDSVKIKVLIGNRGDLEESEYIKIA